MMPSYDRISYKIRDNKSLEQALIAWREAECTLVFTNGCFDLIHIGHLQYLAAAKDLGDKLIVGLNSDASVKRLKGFSRPVKDQDTRAQLLAALEFVDAVILFEEDTPYELIKAVRPDILVKGGDWKPEEIVGADIVLAKGGIVRSLRFVEGHSTSKLVDQIKGEDNKILPTEKK